MRQLFFTLMLLSALFTNCTQPPATEESTTEQLSDSVRAAIQAKLDQYVTVPLTSDLTVLSEKERQMIPLLIDAAQVMDDLFWYESYGGKDKFLESNLEPTAKRFMEINYGPWDRLDDNKPFLPGAGAKPAGANYYPPDMTKEEFDAAELPDKAGLYTFIRRGSEGKLETIPYHQQFNMLVNRASNLLTQAADLAEEPGLKRYLQLRAQALLDDEYQESDRAWLDMKNNTLDVVIGPIETYEDQLFGYKAAHEAYVLIKDQEWSKRLSRFAQFLPELQSGLPVPVAYKQEKPGTDTDLNAYDVVYYAGEANAGGKTIAINLPNDEQVQLEKGTRRLQLKNVMRAKFDKILVPLADELIDPDQVDLINFDAFFANTMFHEVAHGLGIKNTINGKGTVRMALKEHYSALEEGKADILGLYMVKQLHDKGEIDGDYQSNVVTFMASIFRSIRFGGADAHGRANMVRFNFLKDMGAFERDEATGKYRVNFDKFQQATDALSTKILTLQGDGDYQGVAQFVDKNGVVSAQLQADLDRCAALGIPVDLIFDQGAAVLGL
ncbi:MAG: hypothetical protein KDC57_08375 [Saprospiraceae bacterium]|nr:hypothetical protein [Saprospiraceae bacterium]